MPELLETTAQSPSWEWLLLYGRKWGRREVSLSLGLSFSLGKEVTPRRRRGSVTYILGSQSEWTPRQAPPFPPHALSQLCAAGSLWVEMGLLAPPRAFLRPEARQDSGPREMAWVVLFSLGRRPYLKSFFAFLVCNQDRETLVMRQRDLQPLVISSLCVSFPLKGQKLKRNSRKMSKPRAVEAAAAAAAVAATAPGPEMVERRGPGRPRTDGENVFTGQSKIYTYMSPNKHSGMRSPLQEENSVAHHDVRYQGKPLAGIYRKREEKRNAGNAIRSTVKSEEQKIKDARRGPLAPFPNQKSEAAEPPKTPTSSCDPTNTAVAKPALKKPVKGKQAARRRAQGKTQQNRKLTDFYPVRRSSRKSKAELQSEERRRLDELIESGKEEGMKIDLIDGKGRGVIATKQFSRGDFVVEYHGDLIEITDARKREALYAQDPSTGCYMYYFQYLSKTYCVDATRETNRLGRLINHSKCGNCQTKLHDIDGVPHLILIASRDIAAGEELLYDYGDRSKASLEAHPWLKH